MTPDAIANILTQTFGPAVQQIDACSWQIETPDFRLLVLLSEDQSWLRALIPIASAADAEPFLSQLLEANFDSTQEARYALSQGALWGVFQHSAAGLSQEDFSAALQQLISLHQQGISAPFNQLVETQIRQIIQAAKLQGQSLEATLQTLNHFYQEGVMGDMAQGATSREEVLAAWRRQLERLWPEVNP